MALLKYNLYVEEKEIRSKENYTMRNKDIQQQVEDVSNIMSDTSDIKDILLKISEYLDKLLKLLDKPEN